MFLNSFSKKVEPRAPERERRVQPLERCGVGALGSAPPRLVSQEGHYVDLPEPLVDEPGLRELPEEPVVGDRTLRISHPARVAQHQEWYRPRRHEAARDQQPAKRALRSQPQNEADQRE